MKVIIGFTKDEERYAVSVNGTIMAYVYKYNNGKDVRIDDIAVFDSFIMPKADIETAISFIVTAYKNFYKTLGIDVLIPQEKTM